MKNIEVKPSEEKFLVKFIDLTHRLIQSSLNKMFETILFSFVPHYNIN